MIRIKANDKRLEFRQGGDTAYFSVGKPYGRVLEIPVQIDGDELVFFPEKSSAHKRLLKSAGIEV